VGGTRTCGANSPVERATVNVVLELLLNSDSFLFNVERITKAASQKTGIETIKPVKLTTYVNGSFENFFNIPNEITDVAPLFSSEVPISVPNNMSSPIFFEVKANPSKISNVILISLISRQTPKNKDPIKSTSTGCNFRKEVPRIIHATVSVINKISMCIFVDLYNV
jgi:hypothetical protein